MGIRTRKIPHEVSTSGILRSEGLGCADGTPAGPPNISSGNLGNFSGTQTTVSEGHPFHTRKTGLADIGGEFRTTKSYVEHASVKRVMMSETQPGFCPFLHKYAGPICAYIPTNAGNIAFPPSASSSDANLDKYGAVAIAKCAPGSPPADAVTFLGELAREGLPHLLGSKTWEARTKVAKAAGKDYLNATFGWAPLLNEISSFASALTHADKVLAQYEKDAGKVVRRRTSLPSHHSVETTVVATNATARYSPTHSIFYNGSKGDVIRKRETSIERWFSGAFTYYLPSDYDSRKTIVGLASKAEYLLGLNLTPDDVWNLTPWSWAIDWFTNTSDVLTNIGRYASGGLVMRYGYLMEHSIVRDTYTLTETGLKSVRSVAPMVLVTETKVRRRANPFGFGVTWETLSDFQASILAALGITRGK